jgi:putative flippase GtrA
MIASVWEWLAGDRGRTFLRYSVASAVSVVGGQVTLALSFGVAGWPAAPSNVLAFAVGGVVSYVLNRRWTWRRSGRSHLMREIVPFWTIAIVGLAVSTIAVDVAERLITEATESRAIQTLVVMAASLASYGALWIVKFLAFDRYVWRATPSAIDPRRSTPSPPSRARP